jgi:hypothetical protein
MNALVVTGQLGATLNKAADYEGVHGYVWALIKLTVPQNMAHTKKIAKIKQPPATTPVAI